MLLTLTSNEESMKEDRIRQLVDELNSASEAYYNGKSELMTDYEWDARFDELKRLEAETGLVLPESPTQKVSEDNIEGRKEQHEYAALSLAKTKQVGDLVKWAEGRPVWVSWKLDGLTLVATYDNGSLTKLVTRGNGHVGTNITHLAKAIAGIPQTIKAKGHTVIRGEAIISYDNFERFLLESGEDYANPRNLASGSLTLKDMEEVKRRHIEWIPFTLVARSDAPKRGSSQPSLWSGSLFDDEPVAVSDSWGERMAWLDDQGFNTVERERIDNPTIDNMQQAIDRFTLRVTNRGNGKDSGFAYPVDGLVVCYDDTAYAQTGSITGHHATRAGLAYKWQDEAAETELVEIEWSCAASTISPVAIFRPVELEGTTVKRASLCNISECERLGIGSKGTKLSVIKANKIIPKVIKVTETIGKLEIPEQCPVCHHPTEVVESEASGTRTLHCTNHDCPAKQLRKYARFVSKEGMNIDGMSEQTLSRFINLGWISEYADIYRLRSHIADIVTLGGFGEKSATNIIRAIEKARKVDAQQLLYALNIPLAGTDVCKKLLSAYDIPQLIATAHGNPQPDVFAHIDGIGPEKSASIVKWFSNMRNLQMVEQLLAEVEIVYKEPQQSGGRCDGLTFVITGDVHHFNNRNHLKAYIESQGGKVTGSVSKNTSFLINNDVTSASSKNKKAHELGITILSEDDFIAQFG